MMRLGLNLDDSPATYLAIISAEHSHMQQKRSFGKNASKRQHPSFRSMPRCCSTCPARTCPARYTAHVNL